MRNFAYILLITVALIEGSLISFPLTLSVAIGIAINWPSRSFPWLFAAGLILDMFTPRLWGVSALFLVGLSFLLARIQTKISGKGIIFICVFILFVQILYSVLFEAGINIRYVLEGTVLGVLFTVLFARFASSETDLSRLAV